MEKRIISLALAFSAILNEWLTPEQMQEINRLNNTPEYSNGSCATHNFCDPNQAMIDAEQAVIGNGLNPTINKDVDLINAAWGFARANDFFTAIYQPNYAVATGDTLYALSAASNFMSGFVGDEAQDEPVDNDLDIIDREIARLEGKGLQVQEEPFIVMYVRGGLIQNVFANTDKIKPILVDVDGFDNGDPVNVGVYPAYKVNSITEWVTEDADTSEGAKELNAAILKALKEEGLTG